MRARGNEPTNTMHKVLLLFLCQNLVIVILYTTLELSAGLSPGTWKGSVMTTEALVVRRKVLSAACGGESQLHLYTCILQDRVVVIPILTPTPKNLSSILVLSRRVTPCVVSRVISQVNLRQGESRQL